MLSTGLLSLNIHDALAFDGTELCLHPDLFQATAEYGGGVGVSSASNSQPSRPPNAASAAAAQAAAAATTDDSTPAALTNATSSTTNVGNGGMASSITIASSGSSSRGQQQPQQQGQSFSPSQVGPSATGLSVGDMIEVRVWDPLPKNEIKRSPASSVLRKTAPPRQSPATASTGASASASVATGSTDLGLPAASTSSSTTGGKGGTVTVTNNDSALRPRLNSLQYSEASATAAPEAPSMKTTAGTGDGSNTGAGDRLDSIRSMDQSAESAATVSSHDQEGSVSDKEIGRQDDGPPTKTVIMTTSSPAQGATANSTSTAGALPPVFPRGRANTQPHVISGSGGKQTLKPALHRRTPSANATNLVSSLSTHPEDLNYSIESSSSVGENIATTGSGPFVVGGVSPTIKLGVKSPNYPKHSREISDMTVDTHQLDVADCLQPAESHDDDGEDVLSKISSTHKLRLAFVLLVTEKTLTSLKGNARTQVSMLRQVADLYSLSSYDMVTIHKIDPQGEKEVLKAVSADFLLVTIKDQFISRGDMHFFQNALIGTWIYEGQRLNETTRGIKAHAREIRHGNFSAKSGIVTPETMITFRSRSARIFWLLQLSTELWDYTSPYDHNNDVGGGYQQAGVCEIYFDKWIRFIHKLFTRWKELEVTHSLTVVFFSRTILTNAQTSALGCRDVYGRAFEDHYKPIIENETVSDWDSLIVRIKEEFVRYPLDVGWNLNDRRPSTASQGNVLEAINVTLNLMQYHYLDRDLHRSGNSIVVISPGCGVFEVDKDLAGITYQRMMDNGIGSDMLSLGLPPLHIAPFFLYNNEYRAVETRGVNTSETYYEVPHWMHLSFVQYDKDDIEIHGENVDKDVVPIKAQRNLLDSLEVGANGFLLPRSLSLSSEMLPSGGVGQQKDGKSFFSALGNAAATPGKAKIARERQLISGRNFRDILEACRPRLTGLNLPSALTTVLKTRQLVNEMEKVGRLPASATESKQDKFGNKLREWGTVDFTEFGVMSTRNDIQNVLKFSMDIDRPDGSDGSPSSSVASHMSGVYGFSYDRVLWGQLDSPITPKKTMQMQRSASLEFEKLDNSHVDSDTALSEDSMSIGSRSSTRKSSIGGAEDADSAGETDASVSHRYRLNEHAEHLRRIMEARDASFVAPLPAKVDETGLTNPMRTESHVGYEMDVAVAPKMGAASQNTSRQRNKDIKSSGGLGAALSQYSTMDSGISNNEGHSAGGRITGVSSGGLMPQVIPAPNQFQLDRPRSSSPFFPAMGQFFDQRLGVSPGMLLPPIMAQSHVAGPNADDAAAAATSRLISPDGRSLRHNDSNGAITAPVGGSLVDLAPVAQLASKSSAFATSEHGRHRLYPVARSPPSGSGRPKKSIAQSPPKGGILKMERSAQRTSGPRDSHSVHGKQSIPARRKKAFNPFRQRDEDEVLAKRSHNRRRWSHVFPVGEIEFKRHSGPNWKSLTSPAILPLSVDYFPSPHELRDESTFQFSPYTVTLGGLDKKHYATHTDLLMEMVRQRLAQDYQIVTAAAIEESERRAESQRQGSHYSARNMGKLHRWSNGRGVLTPSLPSNKHNQTGLIKHFLSMGHRIQVLNYDPSSDTIEIVHYNKKKAQNDPMNVYTYRFLLFSKATGGYLQSVQTFKKYADPYKWNKVDNLVCGEEDRTMEEGMRFRRIMFGLIPDRFKDPSAEQEYIAKFLRLVEYLEKLREKDDSKPRLSVKVISSADERRDRQGNDVLNVRRGTTDEMIRLTVQLRKLKRDRDPFEWIEIAIDSTFDTSRSYRIMFNWLAASSPKVDAQVQLLYRRCTQFGLKLTSFPHATISRNLFIHPFAAPPRLSIRNKETADSIHDELVKNRDFVYDGIHLTESQILECTDDGDEFDFPKYRSGRIRTIPAMQYVHQSGAVFIRTIRDLQGWMLLAFIENTRLSTRDVSQARMKRAYDEISAWAVSTSSLP